MQQTYRARGRHWPPSCLRLVAVPFIAPASAQSARF